MKKRRTKLTLRQRRAMYMSDEDFSNLAAGLEHALHYIRDMKAKAFPRAVDHLYGGYEAAFFWRDDTLTVWRWLNENVDLEDYSFHWHEWIEPECQLTFYGQTIWFRHEVDSMLFALTFFGTNLVQPSEDRFDREAGVVRP